MIGDIVTYKSLARADLSAPVLCNIVRSRRDITWVDVMDDYIGIILVVVVVVVGRRGISVRRRHIARCLSGSGGSGGGSGRRLSCCGSSLCVNTSI